MLGDAADLQRMCWPDWESAAVYGMLQRAQAQVEIGRVCALVAALNGQAIAYGQVTRWPHCAEISDLIVASGQREQGIGSSLIAALIDVAHGWKTPQVEIGVALSNPRALALYQRLGFKPDRTLDLDLGHGYEPVLYLMFRMQRLPDYL